MQPPCTVPSVASGRLGHRRRRRIGERVIEPGLTPFSSCWPPRRRWQHTRTELAQDALVVREPGQPATGAAHASYPPDSLRYFT